ncbi:MAG TPA: dihydrolipoamide acetyltransferase family protein [Clostridia bacterium]|nr:dihydrolipoamide acetyltransferase family protein [Clostridia bacterium]
MAHAVILPRQGQSVESCIITQWHKQVGDDVREGEVLFSYETDKASFEETAKETGKLLAVFFQEDDDVPVLSTVALIGQPGEDISAFRPETPEQPSAEAPAAPEAAPTAPAIPPAPAVPAPPAASAAGVSPRARMTARRLGVDPAAASPTGPQGRVIEQDVFTLAQAPKGSQATAAAPAATPAPGTGYQDIKLSKVRKLIASTMHQSLSSMAQITHHSSFDATRLLSLRARFKSAPAEMGLNDISMNDLVLFAVSRVLPGHKDLNAHFLGESIRRFDQVHLGLAVDTPRGLLVPTLFSADTKGIRQLSKDARALIEAAQGGAISPDLLTGASFTVTNLGALGIESFTPIINPPQAAILGVCAIVQRVREQGGQLSAYPAMGLSLTYDHRAVDGAPASRFLKDLVNALEQIDLILLGQEESHEL